MSGHQRTVIRRYLVNLLKANIDVAGRVFPNRPSPLFLQELPCVLIHFGQEPAEVIAGDMYSPKQYQRNLRTNIDVITEELIDPDSLLNESQKTEDKMDFLAWQIEQTIFDDWTLGRNLPDYDPEVPNGLTLGMRLVNTEPYIIDDKTERRILANRIQFETPYETDAYKLKRFKDFDEYDMKINRVGWTADTVDPTLIAAEGIT